MGMTCVVWILTMSSLGRALGMAAVSQYGTIRPRSCGRTRWIASRDAVPTAWPWGAGALEHTRSARVGVSGCRPSISVRSLCQCQCWPAVGAGVVLGDHGLSTISDLCYSPGTGRSGVAARGDAAEETTWSSVSRGGIYMSSMRPPSGGVIAGRAAGVRLSLCPCRYVSRWLWEVRYSTF
ncbi:hypothetical protein MAPG_10431 [Magnaporthiopsis poae ATCC 64411]|uniref:Secreted protein n=1 Tax=Magnaporthiopsis poae (strain ATCC 64411 / 73-15) TaxID=644358 RepID=A0A0C4ECK2_MAGP6|nr:hypothetical protein MAPG_10431 [Magnaporthiopsis poae ATCC 64411]